MLDNFSIYVDDPSQTLASESLRIFPPMILPSTFLQPLILYPSQNLVITKNSYALHNISAMHPTLLQPLSSL